MSGTSIQRSFHSVFAIAVLITAFGSLLASASPLPAPQSAPQFSANAFQCVEGDSTGTWFYMGDGTKSQCAPGTVCRYVPGMTWSPCDYPAVGDTVVGHQSPASSAELPAVSPIVPTAAPISSHFQDSPLPSPTQPPAAGSLTDTKTHQEEDEDDEECKDEDEQREDAERPDGGINLGAIEKPSPGIPVSNNAPLIAAPSPTAATVPSRSNAPPPIINAAIEQASTSSGSIVETSALGPAATGNADSSANGVGASASNTGKLRDNEWHTQSQASINPQSPGDVTKCETTFSQVDDTYVAIEPKYFDNEVRSPEAPFFSVCGKEIEITCK
jgi:hypothetical protein